jgi:predicted N-acyltransferase
VNSWGSWSPSLFNRDPARFPPAATFNADWLAHSGLHDAVGGFVAQESREKETAMRMLAERSPFAEAQR